MPKRSDDSCNLITKTAFDLHHKWKIRDEPCLGESKLSWKMPPTVILQDNNNKKTWRENQNRCRIHIATSHRRLKTQQNIPVSHSKNSQSTTTIKKTKTLISVGSKETTKICEEAKYHKLRRHTKQPKKIKKTHEAVKENFRRFENKQTGFTNKEAIRSSLVRRKHPRPKPQDQQDLCEG